MLGADTDRFHPRLLQEVPYAGSVSDTSYILLESVFKRNSLAFYCSILLIVFLITLQQVPF